jgi:hypothetical protein
MLGRSLNLPFRGRSTKYYVDIKGFFSAQPTTQPHFDIKPVFCGLFFVKKHPDGR